jgi:hypothetical protein
LPEFQFASGFIVRFCGSHAQVPVASCGLRPGRERADSQGWSGRDRP